MLKTHTYGRSRQTASLVLSAPKIRTEGSLFLLTKPRPDHDVPFTYSLQAALCLDSSKFLVHIGLLGHFPNHGLTSPPQRCPSDLRR